jgi:hypothetical protein
MENWKWIIYQGHDFTDKYMVSDLGRIKSVDRYSEPNHQFFKGRIIKQRNGRKKTYKVVTLWDNGKQVDVEVHRLVATMFLDNNLKLPCVNHIDGNPSNNCVNNLEWCTYSHNVRHSIEKLGNNPKNWKSKKVAQKTEDGKIIKIWPSAWEIQRTLGFCQVSISRCCRREKKGGCMYGYLWDFA